MKLSRQPAWVYVLPALYLGLCLTIALDLIPSEGSWGWFPAFVAALPFSIVLLPVTRVAPLLVFGVFGTLWWYLVSRIASALIARGRRDMG